MSKCLICNKEKEGMICKHCLAKGATGVGKFAKGAGNIVLKAAPLVISIVAVRKKPKA